MTFNILVLDAKQRSALAVTRSLGRLNDVVVTTADAGTSALAGCSRYSAMYLKSPSAEEEPERYVEWLASHLSHHVYDLVIPVTEITSQLLLMNRDRFTGLSLPFPDYQTVMSLADKGELIKLAEAQGIPCPTSRWFASSADLRPDEETFPLVVKPCLSKIYSEGRWIATRVKIVYSKAELIEELQHSSYLHHSPFMLQEFIPGHGAGIFCLFDSGRPVVFFAHRRLREKPPEGGVSVLSESVAVDSELQHYANRLLAAAGWHGVAMVEFRISPDGKAYLMEVNTRFWGSLQLAIDAGVDFPRLLWQAEQARRGQGSQVVPPDRYRVGQRLRWLLGDFDSLYLYLKSDYSLSQKLWRVVQFVTPRLRYCRHEVNRLDDPGPAKHELFLYIKQLLGR